MRAKHQLFVIAVSTLFAAAPIASAQDLFYGPSGFGGGYGGYGGWWNQPAFGVAGSLYGSGYVPVPPYFSIHPPVYYSSRIVYRPMGDSPFAYPPSRASAIAPVEVEDVEPQLIENPYVDSDKSTAASSVIRKTSLSGNQPKHIYNPFVERRPANSDSQVARVQRGDDKN